VPRPLKMSTTNYIMDDRVEVIEITEDVVRRLLHEEGLTPSDLLKLKEDYLQMHDYRIASVHMKMMLLNRRQRRMSRRNSRLGIDR